MRQMTQSQNRMSSRDYQRFDEDFGDGMESFERFGKGRGVSMPVGSHRRALRESRKTGASRRVSRQIADSRGGICRRRMSKITLR